ncbi:zinc finger protein ZAT3-like [Impatiens glandulifera]|uniref:zinc finger protein ZAT3-like n=1 Tax=Impatiens glandulifera TaxID=253017 RepID=UPI001FB122F1|nr:zinc finger protein ZAT3-like [Impatiens glandulifera]
MSTNSSSPPPPSGDVPPSNSPGAPPPSPSSSSVVSSNGGSCTIDKNVPYLETVLKKRTRNGDEMGAGAPSVPPPLRAVVPPAAPATTSAVAALAVVFTCCICNVGFDSEKSLSGHMRVHPDRPWRGIYPPPVFTVEDFADVKELLNDPEEEEEGEDEENEVADGGEEVAAGGGGGDGEGEFGGRRWILPDLNKTP